MLTTTNLFRRIKHAYDKQEETLYHREAFLHPPLFTQICRKFRNRELPVHMFDIMLIREFGVEEINAQNVAKSFVEGARMTGVIDERNVIADIDQLAAQQGPRRELASGEMPLNLFKGSAASKAATNSDSGSEPSIAAQPNLADLDSDLDDTPASSTPLTRQFVPSAPVGRSTPPEDSDTDPISALFGLHSSSSGTTSNQTRHQPITPSPEVYNKTASNTPAPEPSPTPTGAAPATPAPRKAAAPVPITPPTSAGPPSFMIHISGPGLDTQLHIQDTDDLDIVRILLDKIRKQLS
ncbi:hypothetical protein MTX78_11405 [Hymenobacter tibetensis]|uniref:Uncharacterized protein n=1 Tax=Hymenobacter tibetensis TaxID=497967 RepID=A0ABY4D5A9_9BACT|nr:hypothetical protein [Hymenobacter tibetensis]UOG77184.1 hypothetical protein MTX78_11405 [Hymenobacter tibetensis]